MPGRQADRLGLYASGPNGYRRGPVYCHRLRSPHHLPGEFRCQRRQGNDESPAAYRGRYRGAQSERVHARRLYVCGLEHEARRRGRAAQRRGACGRPHVAGRRNYALRPMDAGALQSQLRCQRPRLCEHNGFWRDECAGVRLRRSRRVALVLLCSPRI